MNDSNTNSFNKSNGYYLFQQSPKATVRRLLKEISMHHLCKNCLECKFQKFAIE